MPDPKKFTTFIALKLTKGVKMDDLSNELKGMHEEEQTDLAESLKEINELANDAYAAKVEASAADQKAKDFKNKLSSLMETAGVDKNSAEDCTVSGKMKASASVPKDVAGKLALFSYIANLDSEGGQGLGEVSKELEILFKYPTLFSMLTINATSFNSWYAKEQQAEIEKGNIDFKLPFISTYEYYSVGFRKKAGK